MLSRDFLNKLIEQGLQQAEALNAQSRGGPPDPRANAIRDRIRQLQQLQSGGSPPPLPATPPPLPTQNANRKGKRKKGQRVEEPTPARVEVAAVRAAPPSAPELSPSQRNAPAGEIARNVRMLLQRNGLCEAVLLGEILGKPKSLQ